MDIGLINSKIVYMVLGDTITLHKHLCIATMKKSIVNPAQQPHYINTIHMCLCKVLWQMSCSFERLNPHTKVNIVISKSQEESGRCPVLRIRNLTLKPDPERILKCFFCIGHHLLYPFPHPQSFRPPVSQRDPRSSLPSLKSTPHFPSGARLCRYTRFASNPTHPS